MNILHHEILVQSFIDISSLSSILYLWIQVESSDNISILKEGFKKFGRIVMIFSDIIDIDHSSEIDY